MPWSQIDKFAEMRFMDTILAGDVGGTKTHLALFTFDAGWKCLREEKFPSKEFPNLTVILAQFLAVGKEKIAKACIGVAGPVEDGPTASATCSTPR